MMSGMAVVKRPSFDLEFLRSHVECPICTEVPRDGVMLMCLNGHNVCAACKTKIGAFAKCPHGRCNYGFPPAKNFTVSSLVASLPFEWACQYGPETGCSFAGTSEALAVHEADSHQTIACPHISCERKVTLGGAVGHFTSAHETPVVAEENSAAFAIDMWFTWELGMNPLALACSDFAWNEVVVATGGPGCWVLLCSRFKGGRMYCWPYAPLTEAAGDETFECEVSMGSDNDESLLKFNCPLFPIEWSTRRVMLDERCARFDAADVVKMLTDERIEHNGGKKAVRINFALSRKKRIGADEADAEM